MVKLTCGPKLVVGGNLDIVSVSTAVFCSSVSFCNVSGGMKVDKGMVDVVLRPDMKSGRGFSRRV